MEIRYLCKHKMLNKSIGGYIDIGDIAYVEFTPSRKAIIKKVGIDKCYMKISHETLHENFILYDEIEMLDTWDMLNVLANKYNKKSNERDIISDIRFYLNNRQNFLHKCETEDTQQEQNSTKTLHTTSL